MALQYLNFLIILVTTSNVTDAQIKTYQSRDQHEGELSVSQLMDKAAEWSSHLGFSPWNPLKASYGYSSGLDRINIATGSGLSFVLNSKNGKLLIFSNGRRIRQRHTWNGTERGRRFMTDQAENDYALSIVRLLEPASTAWTPRFGRKLDGWSQGAASDNCGYFSIMVRDGNGHGISITFDSKDGQVFNLAWLHGKTKK